MLASHARDRNVQNTYYFIAQCRAAGGEAPGLRTSLIYGLKSSCWHTIDRLRILVYDLFVMEKKMSGGKRSYAFTLKGDGIDFAGAVDQFTARSLLNVVLGAKSSSSHELPGVGREQGTASNPPISLREFLDGHGAKRIPEKIVVIGEYLTTNGAVDFTKDDVLSHFRIAREAMPGNFPRDFNWAIATGWVAEDVKNPGRFYVTQSGKQAVDGNFSREVTKNSRFRSVRRKRAGRKSAGGM
jgi:hypothetical protein